MLIDAEQSFLLVVDIQERLVPAVTEGKRVVESSAWLMEVAKQLEVPILMSEQYPTGLGHTVPRLQRICGPESIMEKIHFSCAHSDECRRRIAALGRKQVVLTGMETHVCVLQTALGLITADYHVFVVADAIASRNVEDGKLALERMRGEGVRIVSREMVVFEWLHRAATDQFRDISRRYLR